MLPGGSSLVSNAAGFDFTVVLPLVTLAAAVIVALAGWRWKREDESQGIPPTVGHVQNWQAYLVALCATAAAFGLRLALEDQLHGHYALVIFTLPIFLSAYLGGLRAGLLATALSYFGAGYLMLPPIGSLPVDSPAERLHHFFVAMAGIFISGLSEKMHRERHRAEHTSRALQQAELARRESEGQFSSSFIHSPVGMALVGPDGRYLKVNAALAQMVGYTQDELLGLTFRDITFAGDLDDQGRVQRLVAGKIDSFTMEKRYVHRLGHLVTGLLSVALVRDAQGRPTFQVAQILDITQRKQSEEAAFRLAALVAGSSDAIVGLDLDGRITSWNEGAEKMFGFTAAEMLGSSARRLFPPEHLDNALTDAEMVQRGDAAGRFETVRLAKDGRRVPVSITASPIKDASGRIIGASRIARDITESLQAAEQVRRLNEELEQRVAERTEQLEVANRELQAFSTAVTRDLRVAEAADLLKSAFLATMSHELRTPLNSIIGFTGIVLMEKAGPLNPEQSKQLSMVRESAWHLLALINDVLDLSKIEAGQLEVRADPFGLPAAIGRVVDMVGPLAEKKGLLLVTEVSPSLGQLVSDQRRVEQILINLLTNAVKFTSKGRVTLTAEPIDLLQPSQDVPAVPAVRLRVADTGLGIKPDDLELLFQPFRQVDSGTARRAEGTGLGLAICRRLAILLGGNITVASKWSQGSEFTVTLPLRKPDKP